MFPLLLFLAALLQWLFTLWFKKWLRLRPKAERLAAGEQQSTWAVICVRGADPSLKQAIQRLLDQDYQSLKICVMVDHESDLAHEVIAEIKTEVDDSRLLVRNLKSPLSTCSLKCSALAEGIEFLFEHDPAVVNFVMFDADAGIDSEYVSRLVKPLTDPTVGLVSGVQWFEPSGGSGIGTIVRSLWNAGAVFFGMLFQNPWAGAFALRASDVEKLALLDLWRSSAVDDGPLKKRLAQHDLRCVTLPGLATVNKEECSNRFFLRWTTRILTWSRIHEPGFWLTFTQMVFATTLIVGSLVDLMRFPSHGLNWILFWGSGVLSVLAWSTIRQAVRENSRCQSEFGRLGFALLLKAVLVMLIVQAFYAIACCRAAFAKNVRWRGVEYRINSMGLTLREYRPYSGTNDRGHSID